MSKAITNKILHRKAKDDLIVFYRRVSTAKQNKGNGEESWKRQGEIIKREIPAAKISKKPQHDQKEIYSGFAPWRDRVKARLGSALRLLKRHRCLILVVANADRISRRAEDFCKLQESGFGQRIYDVSRKMSLDEIVQNGVHLKIEARSKYVKERCQKGLKQYILNSGVLGRPGVSSEAHKGGEAMRTRAEYTKDEVLKVLRNHSLKNEVSEISMKELAYLLDEKGIKNSRGSYFTPTKLSQLKKKMNKAWEYALNSHEREECSRRRRAEFSQIFKCQCRRRHFKRPNIKRKMAIKKRENIYSDHKIPRCTRARVEFGVCKHHDRSRGGSVCTFCSLIRYEGLFGSVGRERLPLRAHCACPKYMKKKGVENELRKKTDNSTFR